MTSSDLYLSSWKPYGCTHPTECAICTNVRQLVCLFVLFNAALAIVQLYDGGYDNSFSDVSQELVTVRLRSICYTWNIRYTPQVQSYKHRLTSRPERHRVFRHIVCAGRIRIATLMLPWRTDWKGLSSPIIIIIGSASPATCFNPSEFSLCHFLSSVLL